MRTHADAVAAESAEAIGAKAYTIGYNIAFGAGHCNPGSASGRRLIAHELMHAIQQQGSGNGGSLVQRECTDPYLCPSDDPLKHAPPPTGYKESGAPENPQEDELHIIGLKLDKGRISLGFDDSSTEDSVDWLNERLGPRMPQQLPPKPKNCPVERWNSFTNSCCGEGKIAKGLSCEEKPLP